MRNDIVIPKTLRKKFTQYLKNASHEDLASIEMVEGFLKKKRGHVFKMPKPGSSIILLVSGGLDSTTTWELLLRVYKLKIYPLYVFRDKKRSYRELEAVKFFHAYFSNKYPKQLGPLKSFGTELSPPEILREMKMGPKYFHPNRILDLAEQPEKYNHPNFYPQRILPFLHVFYGLVYAEYLFDRYDVKIRTILTAILVEDGKVVPSQTHTSLRTAMLAACQVTGDYSWQYGSFTYDREMEHMLYKRDLIQMGVKMGIPFERAWTCYGSGPLQCGNRCRTCKNRRRHFKEAGVTDPTLYKEDLMYMHWLKRMVVYGYTHIVDVISKLKGML